MKTAPNRSFTAILTQTPAGRVWAGLDPAAPFLAQTMRKARASGLTHRSPASRLVEWLGSGIPALHVDIVLEGDGGVLPGEHPADYMLRRAFRRAWADVHGSLIEADA